MLLFCGLALAAVIYFTRRGDAPTEAEPVAKPEASAGARAGQAPARPAKRPKIDIALALDTSSSMTGLLQAARQRMWEIVNEVAKIEPIPDLRVALISYGKRGTEQDGYIEIQSDFTTDLDAIYAKLHELDAFGGCGAERVTRAIARSVKELSWSTEAQTLRQIYVAGNESAEQDNQVSLAAAVKLAQDSDIFVNTIFCAGATIRDHSQDDSKDVMGWRKLAEGGRGLFAAINHDKAPVAIKTPYDDTINALGAQLNQTYVAYGAQGQAKAANQRAQDDNALRLSATVAASRTLAKASRVYRNDSWDLVDARKAGKLAKIQPAALPAPLKGKSGRELNAYLDGVERQRKTIQTKIKALDRQRAAYVDAEQKKRGAAADADAEELGFGVAVKRALRSQAAKKFRSGKAGGKLRPPKSS